MLSHLLWLHIACGTRHYDIPIHMPKWLSHLLWLHIACCTRRYDITFLMHGAACLSSLMMGKIDLLVSQIPASVSVFFQVRKILDLASRDLEAFCHVF